MNSACATVHSKPKIKRIIKASVGDNTNLPIKLKIRGNENLLIFRKALCAPSVINAIARNALDRFSMGLHRKKGIFTESELRTIPKSSA